MNVDERRGVGLALAGLDEVGPARLRALLAAGPPLDVWGAVQKGAPPIAVDESIRARWVEQASGVDPVRLLEAHLAAGVGVVTIGEPGYPACLAADRSPPGVLVWRGDLGILGAPSVGVVGTRRCSRYGREVAAELGADLTTAGISVVSGLALGIDGAAHEGSLASRAPCGRPIGVVAGGLDVLSPRRHRPLADRIADAGVLLTEVPLGTEPRPWRFPSRNRVIAALSDVLVVVESDFGGGSMHTVRQADDRGRTVLAVPGPVTSRTSRGTNQLLAEGCPPCRDATDVVVALGLSVPSSGASSWRAAVHLSGDAEAVLSAMRWEPTSFDELVARTGLPIGTVSVALAELLEADVVAGVHGWYERTGVPS